MSEVQEVSSAADGLLALHYRDSVRKFLKTVVVFDDQAFTHGSVENVSELQAPTDAMESLVYKEPTSPDMKTDTLPVSEPTSREILTVGEDHYLNGPDLVKLFAAQGIICSIIEPSSKSEVEPIIEEIVTISQAADVLILDWELRRGDYTATIGAIERIIEKDNSEGGRLRFIVIYTAARTRDVNSVLKVAFKGAYSKVGQLFKVGHACITVLNKPSVAHRDGIELEALPNKIFDLHSQFSSGLLPAAALSAIGTIRNHTHQILGQFENSLDAAFITHRALIPKADDAESHLIELVADTILHIMLAEGVRTSLSNDLCTARLIELHQGEIEASAISVIRDCVSSFKMDKLAAMRTALGIHADEPHPQKKIIGKFYLNEHNSELARKGMAFLHDFSRSHLHKISVEHPPRMSLGTVVAVQVDQRYEYYVCIQPRCDSVRFDGLRGFPFMRLSSSSSKPNIYFFWAEQYRSTRLSENLYDMSVFTFGSKSITTDVVQAERDPEGSSWVFNPLGGQSLYWVGDLRKEKAQRLVSKIASRLHLPGINEYELTRQD